MKHKDLPFHQLDRGWQCPKCGNVISPAHIICPVCRLKEENDPFKKKIVCYTDVSEVTDIMDLDITDIKKSRVHFFS